MKRDLYLNVAIAHFLCALAVLLICCLAGCNGCNATPETCGISCTVGGGHMKSYGWQTGCECEPRTSADGGVK